MWSLNKKRWHERKTGTIEDVEGDIREITGRIGDDQLHYHACECRCHNETHYFIQLIHFENRKHFNLKWTRSQQSPHGI